MDSQPERCRCGNKMYRLGLCSACYDEHRQRPKPSGATRPRQYKRRADAKLTREQVFAAYRLYQAGVSTCELADHGWSRWGYVSSFQARMALLRAFRLEGLSCRAKSDAQKLAERKKYGGRCNKCGAPMEERTPGCHTCGRRHRRWEAVGEPFVPA